MNQDIVLSSDRDVALQALVEAQRISQAATDQMDEAFAQLLGVNRTDARCLDIVHRHGSLPAGALGREAGLTSGAVTAVIDRMVAAGYLARRGDPDDRRKVLVVPTQHVEALAEAVYGQIGRIGRKHMGGMPLIQIHILTRYLRAGAWINAELARHLREVIAQNPASDPTATGQAFAARVADTAEALDQGLVAAWQGGGPQ